MAVAAVLFAAGAALALLGLVLAVSEHTARSARRNRQAMWLFVAGCAAALVGAVLR